MNKTYIEKIKEIMANPSQLNLDMLHRFIEETLQYFRDLQEIIKSEDAEKKAAALKEASELKSILEAHMAAISKQTGMSPEEMMTFAANHSKLNDSEWKLVEEARQKLMGTEKKKVPTASKPVLKIIG